MRISDDMASNYQKKLFDAVLNSTDHLVVEAVAGSGKTSSTLEAVARLVENGQDAEDITLLAFNKSISDEIQSRLQSFGVGDANAQTTHSFGYMVIRANSKDAVRVDKSKTRGIVNELIPIDKFEKSTVKAKKYSARNELLSYLDMLRAGVSEPTQEGCAALRDHHGFDWSTEPAMLAKLAKEAIRRGLLLPTLCDFGEMLWLPIYQNMDLPPIDILFVDEAQDLNEIQHALILRLAAKGTRVIIVGDSRQAIYGWRGAVNNSMHILADALAETRPVKNLALSLSYRCPKTIVEMAKKFVPEFSGLESAEEGTVRDIPEEAVVNYIEDDDLVLCRINAPLTGLACKLVVEGKKVTIRGRDFGYGLISMIRGMKAHNVEDLMDKLEVFRNKEAERLGNRQAALDAVMDKCDCIEYLCAGRTEIQEVLTFIETIFNDTARPGVTLSSIHRAKGLEENRVIILRPDLLPFPKAKEEWQMQQERNLEYVAITRAKKELVFARKTDDD